MIKPYVLSTISGVFCLVMVFEGAAQQVQEGRPLKLSVNVLATATDNRDATATDKTDNIDIYLRPRASYNVGTEAMLLDFFYEPGLRYRSEPGDDEDQTDFQHLLGINLRYSASERLRLRFSNRLSVSDDPAIIERGSVVRGNQGHVLNQARAGLNYDLFRYSNLDLQLMNSIRRYDDDDVATRSDVDETGFRVQHRRSLTPTLRTLISGEYRMYTYNDDLLLDRDFESFVAAGGLENAFSENTVGSIIAGWQTRDYDDSVFDSEGKPYVRAEISGLLNPDLRVGAVAGFGLRDSDAFPYASQEYKDFRGFADIFVTPSVLLRLAATYRLSTYEQLGLFLPGGDETTLIGDVEIVFNMTESVAFMTGLRVEDVDSDAGVGASYTKNTGRLGASVFF